MSSGFLYPEWCTVNGVEDWDPKLIYVCLRILISGRSFMLSKYEIWDIWDEMRNELRYDMRCDIRWDMRWDIRYDMKWDEIL